MYIIPPDATELPVPVPRFFLVFYGNCGAGGLLARQLLILKVSSYNSYKLRVTSYKLGVSVSVRLHCRAGAGRGYPLLYEAVSGFDTACAAAWAVSGSYSGYQVDTSTIRAKLIQSDVSA